MKRVVLAVLFLGLSLFFGVRAYLEYAAGADAGEMFDSLAEQINLPPVTARPSPSIGPEAPEKPGTGEPPAAAAPAEDEPSLWTPADKYSALFERNEDMIGWIAIDGTAVNYPVMHAPDRKDFYLKRNFERGYCDYGVPYAAEHAPVDPQGGNIVIYGHNMKNGTMFAALESYKDRAFYERHPIIRFDTRAGFGLYEIIAVFTVYPADFDYHLFTGGNGTAEFDEFTRRCAELSFYETGAAAEYGDKLITLSTCEYTRQDNRLVVVAKQTELLPHIGYD